jgi:hypothetical protein
LLFSTPDDVWLPGKLSAQVAIFQENPGIGMAAEASDYWYDWDDANKKNVLIPIGTVPDKSYNPPSLMGLLYPLSTGAAPCPSSLMLTKEAIQKVGNFEESFIKEFSMYEDQAFLSKIYLQEKVYISSLCNNLYRQRPESIVKTVRLAGLYHKVRKYYLVWLEAYLKKKEIKDQKVLQLLKRALLPYRHPTFYFLTNTAPSKVQSLVKRVYKRL